MESLKTGTWRDNVYPSLTDLGRALFAKEHIKEGELICKYEGDIRPKAEMDVSCTGNVNSKDWSLIVP